MLKPNQLCCTMLRKTVCDKYMCEETERLMKGITSITSRYVIELQVRDQHREIKVSCYTFDLQA